MTWPSMRVLAELLRIAATLGVVLGTTALLLAGLDKVPYLLRGVPVGVVHVADVAEAQRRMGARLLVPAYFPDTLAWPPARIDMVLGPPATVALRITNRVGDREGREEQLRIAETASGLGPLPRDLWPEAKVLHVTRVTVGDEETELLRVLTDDGVFWHELSFTLAGRRISLRSRGGVEELLRMARSMEHVRT
jgi:hypothetical protein